MINQNLTCEINNYANYLFNNKRNGKKHKNT